MAAIFSHIALLPDFSRATARDIWTSPHNAPDGAPKGRSQKKQPLGPPMTHDSLVSCNTHMLHGAGIFTYIWVIFRANVGKYSMHGAYGTYI